MATAIKMTKQKSPEACYDKLIQIAEQIHSYIDFQESLITSITPNLISGETNTQPLQLQPSSTVIIPVMSTQEFPASLDQLLIK